MRVISVIARPISAKITPQRRNAAKNLSSAISAVMQDTGLAASAHSSQNRPWIEENDTMTSGTHSVNTFTGWMKNVISPQQAVSVAATIASMASTRTAA